MGFVRQCGLFHCNVVILEAARGDFAGMVRMSGLLVVGDKC